MRDYCEDLSNLANKVTPLVIKPRTVAAIAATVGALSKATGTTWGYDEESDSFYEMTPIKNIKTTTPPYETRKSEYGGEFVNANIIDAWEALMASGIPDRKYSEGNTPGQQGTKIDKTEYVCKQFALDATNYLNSIKDEKGNQKFHVKAMGLLGIYTYGYDENGNDLIGQEVAHELIVIEDRENAIAYWIDPTAGVWSEKEETQLSSMQKWIKDPRSYVPFETTRIPMTTRVEFEKTPIEPQTGQTGLTGYDLTGTKMALGEKEFKITYIDEMKTPIIEEKIMQYDTYGDSDTTYILPVPLNMEDLLVHSDDTYDDKELKRMEDELRKKGFSEEFIARRRADPYYITEKQPEEIEKENAWIRLNAMKNRKETKTTEELKAMNPLQSEIQQTNKNEKIETITINQLQTTKPIALTNEELKQLEEIEDDIRMWTGE
jgi:hypothetical protein